MSFKLNTRSVLLATAVLTSSVAMGLTPALADPQGSSKAGTPTEGRLNRAETLTDKKRVRRNRTTRQRPSGSVGSAKQDRSIAEINRRLDRIERALGLRRNGEVIEDSSFQTLRRDVGRLQKKMRYLRPVIAREKEKQEQGIERRRRRARTRSKQKEVKENVAETAREAGRQATGAPSKARDKSADTARKAKKKAGSTAGKGARKIRKKVGGMMPGGK